MLQEQSRFYQRLLFFADVALVATAWILAYYLRFEVLTTWPMPLPEWLPLERYLTFLPWILIVAAFVFWASGLYVPDRAQRLTSLVFSVAKAVALALLVVMAFFSLYRDFYVSRLTIIFFAMLTPTLMVALRLTLYFYVRRARQHGKNMRRVLIVGAGVAGRRLERSFEARIHADVALVATAWILAYYLRFEVLTTWPMPLPEWLPLERYLTFLPWILIVAAFVFWASGLYVPDRAQRLTSLVFSVAKAVALALLVVMAFFSFYRDFYVSRFTIIFFAILTPTLMVALRLSLYFYVRQARQHGKNLRRVLIVGASVAGRRLERSFKAYPWMGFEVVGFLDDHKREEPDVLGTIDEAIAVVDRLEETAPIDYVYIALPLSAAARIETLLDVDVVDSTSVCCFSRTPSSWPSRGSWPITSASRCSRRGRCRCPSGCRWNAI